MKISYCITVCNEFVEIQRLVTHLLANKRQEDEIVVLYDQTNGDYKIEEFLRSKSINGEFNWHTASFQGNFSDWKNKLSQLSSGDYIFNIDADEIPHLFLLENIHTILETNPDIDLIWVPRINTLEADSKLDVIEYVKSQNWSINSEGWINWPYDYQGRIYKNSNQIYWIGKVHEKLTGYKAFSKLPALEEYSIYHPKTLDRQIKQNQFYGEL